MIIVDAIAWTVLAILGLSFLAAILKVYTPPMYQILFAIAIFWLIVT